MAMTRNEKIERTRKVAQWTYRKWASEGDRFYRYKGHYYLRAGNDSRYLIDFSKEDDIIDEVWESGGLPHPSCQYKKVLVAELLLLAKGSATTIDSKGLKLADFTNPSLSDIDKLEQFVNACDERNN